MNLVLHASTFKSAAMKEGTQKEAGANKTYIPTLQKEGHSADIEDYGLTILRELPILGPSPDGVVKFSCECCKHTMRLLEVKCPQKTKNRSHSVKIRWRTLSGWHGCRQAATRDSSLYSGSTI